jgi:N-acetylglucosaminyl-diphospho-decaprenol L-rhamnosyltransferase
LISVEATQMDLSIIIVNWNSLDYLQGCLASIYRNTSGLRFEIIVVDNASPNGDVDILRTIFPAVKIIKCHQNLGYARANNLGFKTSAGAAVLMLNPDTELVGPAINRLVEALRSLPDAGIIGGKHVNPNLTVQTTSIHRFPTVLKEVADIEVLRRLWPRCPLWSIGPLFSRSLQPVSVDIIPGACMLLRREVFEQVGMFSEEYFMYAEDIDLNYKVAKAGYKRYFIPDAVIIHYGGGSSSRQTVNQWATRMQLHAMSQYYAKTRSRGYAGFYKAAMAVCALGRLSVIAIARWFGSALLDRENSRHAKEKWSVILRWAVGLDGSATGGGGTVGR